MFTIIDYHSYTKILLIHVIMIALQSQSSPIYATMATQNYFRVYTKLGHNQTQTFSNKIHRKHLGLEDGVSG
jgi:hypothetical protein